MIKPRTVGLLVNPQKEIALEFIKEIVSVLSAKGIACLISDEHFAKHADLSGIYAPESMFSDSVDMIISLGGDGTILRAARCVGKNDIPIFGINLGGLGFMTGSSRDSYLDDLEKIISGKYCIEERMTLECSIGGRDETFGALNDVVVSRESISRVISLKVYIDDEYLTTYTADGIIVSTPTGSTAHSLSAGGPIISPDTEMILITPICPHTLTNRPLITNKDSKIKILLKSSQGQGLITIDGQNVLHIQPENPVTITCAPYKAKLISVGTKSYFEILRQKLKWGGER
jgi:NAD+ kinase